MDRARLRHVAFAEPIQQITYPAASADSAFLSVRKARHVLDRQRCPTRERGPASAGQRRTGLGQGVAEVLLARSEVGSIERQPPLVPRVRGGRSLQSEVLVRYLLRMGADLFGQLQNHAARFRPRESASLMLVGRSRTGDDETLLARRAIPLNPDAYEVQEQDRLVVHPRVINSALALCEANNLGHPVLNERRRGRSTVV